MQVLTVCEVWAAGGCRMEPIWKAVQMKLSALGMIYENDMSYLWQSLYWYIHMLAVQWLINSILFHGSMWNKYKFTWAILTPDQQQGAPPVCLPNFSFYYSWCHDSPL
jgi:hypothetical protein